MNTIICIGDSITEGIGSSSPEKCYVGVLQSLLGKAYEVCNFGRNGATLTEPRNGKEDNYRILPQFSAAIDKAKEANTAGNDAVISIMLGTNDADVADYGYPTDDSGFRCEMHDSFISEYLLLIDSFHEILPQASFVITKCPYSYDTVKHKDFGNLQAVWSFIDEIVSICNNKGISCYLNDLSSVTAPSLMDENEIEKFYYDRLHPSDYGHSILAGCFFAAIKHLTARI